MFTSLLFWGGAFFLSAIGVGAQTPPGFSPSTERHLIIEFGDAFVEPPGIQIGINVPMNPPTLALSHLPPTTSTYLFTLVDPDAPEPSEPSEAQFLHMLLPSIPPPASSSKVKGNFVLDTTTPTPFVPFVNPTPPNDSPAHRYIGLLFVQPEDFVIPKAFRGFSDENRTNFNVTVFAEEAGLGEPVFANWFLVSNQTIF